MKGYLKRIGLFLAALFVVVCVLQGVISLNTRNKCMNGHDNLHQTENLNADLVFMGSSRCRAHFDPDFFDSVYHLKAVNLGVDGHSEIAMQLLRLKLYLRNNKAPKYVVLNFDPLVTGGSIEGNRNYVHKNDFARYAFFADRSSAPMAEYFHYDALERYIPLYSIVKYQLFWQSLNPKGIKYPADFYDKHASPSEMAYKDNANEVHFVAPASFGVTKDSLSIFNTYCKSNNIELICVQTPVYKMVYDSIAFSYAGKICRELDIPFINACTPELRDDQSNFYNADHLNFRGVTNMNRFLSRTTVLDSLLKKQG